MPTPQNPSPFRAKPAPFGRVSLTERYRPFRYSGTKIRETETSVIRARRYANEILALCDAIDNAAPVEHPLPEHSRVVALIPMDRGTKARMTGRVISYDETIEAYEIRVSIYESAPTHTVLTEDVWLIPATEDES